MTATAEEFERHRPGLFAPADRMLGAAHEAEDAVQDAYPRFSARRRGHGGAPRVQPARG
ncbi:hypothetical protein ACVV2G_13450 [Streptomyces ziwulingensis]